MLPGEEHQQGPALPHPQGRFFFDTTHCLQGRFQGCCRDAALQCFSACAFPDLFTLHPACPVESAANRAALSAHGLGPSLPRDRNYKGV